MVGLYNSIRNDLNPCNKRKIKTHTNIQFCINFNVQVDKKMFFFLFDLQSILSLRWRQP